ncbi:Ferredoxin, partial [Dysosmobacter welbionis]
QARVPRRGRRGQPPQGCGAADVLCGGGRRPFPHRLCLHPGPGCGPAVLLRGLGGPLRRVRRRHR